jgi:hypothetical protein
MIYILDTNVFISARNTHFGFDLCPSFWAWLQKSNKENVLATTIQVKDELLKRNDDVAKWIHAQAESFFYDDEEATNAIYPNISKWAQNISTNDQFKHFSECADGHLVSHAKRFNCKVVTLEIAKGNNLKIPNICSEFHVEWISPYQMFREVGITFLLQQ